MTARSHPLSEDGADELRAVALANRDEPEAVWQLAEALYLLRCDPAPLRRRGFTSWDQWVTTELSLGMRKAQDLCRLHSWFRVEHPLPRRLEIRLRRLGWTKARVLMGRVEAANAEHLISNAETCNRRELEARVRADVLPRHRVETGVVFERFEKVSLFLAHADDDECSQYRVFHDALAAAALVTGSDKQGHNVSLICQDFLAGSGGRARSLHYYLRGLERMLGIRLVAFDRSTAAILFGADDEQAFGEPGSEIVCNSPTVNQHRAQSAREAPLERSSATIARPSQSESGGD